jgi:uncharacterized DUF497 family protein
MEFEWDENKRQANIAKHGIDFIAASAVFNGSPTITFASPRGQESRWKTTGLANGRPITVIWTLREGRIRIISARRARHGEERTHREAYARRD